VYCHATTDWYLVSRTLHQFRLLLPRAQWVLVLTTGTYLAQSWEDEAGVNPYYLPDEGRGFFVEVGVDDSQ
jgi:hypothetical protein